MLIGSLPGMSANNASNVGSSQSPSHLINKAKWEQVGAYVARAILSTLASPQKTRSE